jgi:hypothetical protein
MKGPELWSQKSRPLLGNGSVNVSMTTTYTRNRKIMVGGVFCGVRPEAISLDLRGLNMEAVKLTTVQVTKFPL